MPYLIVAFLTADPAGAGPNAALDRHASLIRWGASDLAFVHELYPPVPTALAGLLPGGVLALAIAGALVAGIVLHVLWERLVLLGQPRWVIAPVLVAIGAAPAYALTAVDDLAAFVSLALLMTAIAGVLAFAGNGDTGGGFQAGLALGVAAVCNLAAVGYALALSVAAPMIARHRYRGVPHSVRATMLVVLFPTVAGLGGWAFLEWRYTREVFHTVRENSDLLRFRHGFPAAAVDALTATAGAVAQTPLFLVAAAVLVLYRPLAALALALPVVGLLIGTLAGFPTTDEQNCLLLMLVGAMSLPMRPSRPAGVLFAVAAVVQLAVAWAAWAR